ncbi:hypothetical protein RB195_017844 [Necator americanus]|uniref:Protein RIC1 homolog n=1 Tax=Necator americanus TaxID=51031 RepID=A0ABR1C8T9_NECAM
MYIPVDRETKFRLPVPNEDGDLREHRIVKCIASNREKIFMAIVTSDCVYIWLAYPHLLLCTLRISAGDVIERGTLNKAYWNYDSSHIVITTSRNNLLIYKVIVSSENCYNLIDPPDVHFRRSSQELFLRGPRPSLSLFPSIVVNLAAPASCCVPLREELFVCLRNGFIHHISWDGQVRAEYSLKLSGVPFAHDQLQSKPDFVTDQTVHVIDAVYAPLVGGYCIVLSDGRAALLTSSDSRFHPNSVLGVWALNMKDATCTDVNHKFRLLTFGCANGDVAAYHLDDADGSLVQTFRVALKVQNGPDVANRVGNVSGMQVLTNGGAFVAVWSSKAPASNGCASSNSQLPPTLAVFTPFGTQTWCSLESITDGNGTSVSYTSVDWGPEGYHLWLGRSDGLAILPMARSAALCNPVMDHTNHIVLLCSSRILISSKREREGNASAPHAVWSTLNPPHEYIASNWPIRYAAVDQDSAKTLVVAGLRGLAHCTLPTGRWKIFGNESHEASLMVTGGVLIWGGTVGTACYDVDSTREQLRFYPLNKKLDNRYASIHELECRVIMMSLRSDALVTFDIDGRIMMYHLEKKGDSADEPIKVLVDQIAEIRVGDLVTHPACLVSIHLTQLSLDSSASSFFTGVDTVLINVSGRLLTLNPHKSTKDVEMDEPFQLNQPIMVASFVEQIWHYRAVTDEEPKGLPHLINALWINCGSRGMRVWLPLISARRGMTSQDTSFISKRIMLPFELDICPLVICSNDCLAVGVESLPTSFYSGSKRAAVLYSLHRNSEVFAHHILRQLLKRNLGVFALEVAAACRGLPHFPHSLELLLHGVLEEEATSSEPIPDPLLPRCVAFIQEFPEFLRTVAHCARKTELALWSSLFAVTGSPNDLFEVCLRDSQLHTAASYLIVLQSIESTQTSQEQALRLLREALSAGEWSIAKDMVRFTRAIGLEDMDSPARTPPPSRTSSRRHAASINSVAEADDLVFARFQAAGRISKVRHSHADSRETNRKDSTGSSGKKAAARVASNDNAPPSPTQANPVAEKMNAILDGHAAHLLEEYCIRDLGFFVSALDLDIYQVLSPAVRKSVHEFPLALTRVHSQFSWPYPVASKKMVDQLEKRLGSMRCSRSAISLNGPVLTELTKSSKDSDITPTATVGSQEKSDLRAGSSSPSGDSTTIEFAHLLPVRENGNHIEACSSTLGSPGSSMTQFFDTPDGRGANTSDWQGVTLLVGEHSSGGSADSLAQMSQLISWLSNAGCLDWVFILCVVSRDIVRLRAEINVESVKKVGTEAFKHMMCGCGELLEWATQNCLGYVSILRVFAAHLEIVAEAVGLSRKHFTKRTSSQDGGLHTNNKSPPFKLASPPSENSLRASRTMAGGPKLRETFGIPGRRGRERTVGTPACCIEGVCRLDFHYFIKYCMAETPQLVKGRADVKLKNATMVGVEVKESKVTNIQAYSLLIGHLFVGDIIVAVNGVKITNTDEFIKALNSKLPGVVAIEYLRDEMCTCDVKPLPAIKPGCELFEVTITWRSGGTPIGLLIHRNFSGRVVVAMVESGCTASKVVKPGDVLVKVNDKELIMESINSSKRVSLTLERLTFLTAGTPPLPSPRQQGSSVPSSKVPDASGLKSPIRRGSPNNFKLSAPPINTKVDVALPADVLAILEANKNFFMVQCTLPPCLKKSKGSVSTAHLEVAPVPHTETSIPYDPSPKPLKVTPKREGPKDGRATMRIRTRSFRQLAEEADSAAH